MIHLDKIVSRSNDLLQSNNLPPLTPREIVPLAAIAEQLNRENRVAEPSKVKPSIEEARQEAQRIVLSNFEAERFYDYYSANGWRIGKNPMRDWRAALRNWKRSSIERAGNRGSGIAV